MNYQTWSALNVGENGNDFQKIARDSNFQFNTHKGRVNWNQIEKLSVDRLIDEQNVSLLGHNINNVVNFDIESEFDVRILNSNFVKIFKLSQLTNDFLLHCKRHLTQQNYLLKNDLEKTSKKISMVRKENIELKKIIHWNKWRSGGVCPGDVQDMEAAMCEICGKLFQFESYLVMHLNRRHPGSVPFQIRKPDSFMTNFETEPGECGGSLHPPPGGYKITRDHRYTSELESLRKLITSKLGTNGTQGPNLTPGANGAQERNVNPGTLGMNQNEGVGTTRSHGSNEPLGSTNPGVQGCQSCAGVERPKSPPTCQKKTDGQSDVRKLLGEVVHREEVDQKITKEEYEKHLNTIEQTWKKQFQDLDTKYQNEISKLQEELKGNMETNKQLYTKTIFEKDGENKVGNEKENKENRKPVNFEREVIRQMNFPGESGSTNQEIMSIKIQKINKEKLGIKDIDQNKSVLKMHEDVERNNRLKIQTNETIQPSTTYKVEDLKERETDMRKEMQVKEKYDSQDERRISQKENSEELKRLLWNETDGLSLESTNLRSSHVQEESGRSKKITRQHSMVQNHVPDSSIEQSKHYTGKGLLNAQLMEDLKPSNNEIGDRQFEKTIPSTKSKPSQQDKLSDSQETDAIKTVRNDVTNSISTPHGTKAKPDEEGNKQTSNYNKFLESLNENSEHSRKQLKNPRKHDVQSKTHEKSPLFFTNMDTAIFNFNSTTANSNESFYSEDFARNIGRHVAIDAESVRRIFHDRTFKLHDKSLFELQHERELLSKVFDDDLVLAEKGSSKSKIDALMKKIDCDEQFGKTEDLPKSIMAPKLSVEKVEGSKLDKAIENIHKSVSYPNIQLEIQQTLKHSEKYFGDISKREKIEPIENAPKLLTDSSSETLDKLINVINPDTIAFYDEIIGPNTSESFDRLDKELTDSSDDKPTEDTVGNNIVIEQIRGKDLSVIDEETETDSSMLSSIKTNGQNAADMGSSSADSSSLNNSTDMELEQRETFIDNLESDRIQSNKEPNTEIITVDKQLVDLVSNDSSSMDWNRGNSGNGTVENENSNFKDKGTHGDHAPYQTTVVIHDIPETETIKISIGESIKENMTDNGDASGVRVPQDKDFVPENIQITIKEVMVENKDLTSKQTRQRDDNHDGMLHGDVQEKSNDLKTLAVKEAVKDKFERVLKTFNLHPDWLRLPQKSFEQKMQIIMHERTMKTKTIKNFETKKSGIKRKVESLYKEKTQGKASARGGKLTKDDRTGKQETRGKMNDDKNTNVNIPNEIKNERKVISEDRGGAANKNQRDITVRGEDDEEKKIKDLKNKKLIQELTQDFMKTASQEFNQQAESSELLVHNFGDLIPNETSVVDQSITTKQNNIYNRVENIHPPELVIVAPKISTRNANNTITNNQTKLVDKSQTKKNTGSAKTSVERNPSNIVASKTSPAPKKAFESRLTKHMYSSEDKEKDILDRQPDYLQTNNFTSKQSIGKSTFRGYNFLGKYIKTTTPKLSETAKKRNSESDIVDKSVKVNKKDTRCKSSVTRGDNRYSRSSTNAREDRSSENGGTPISQDMFLIKAPYNISTTAESNFQVKPSAAKQDPMNNRITTSVNTTRSLLGSHLSTTDDSSESSQTDTHIQQSRSHTTKFTKHDKSLNTLKAQTSKSTGDNFGARNNQAYVVPNERNLERKVNFDIALEDDTPLRGTIRRIVTNAINRDESDSSSSFELDDFLQKNNIG